MRGDLMSGNKDHVVHWVSDAPTSLHGNGSASSKLTTRFVPAVTCRLCLSLLCDCNVGHHALKGHGGDPARCAVHGEPTCL